jgi:tRNA threonylcarbamoyladenosine biosynthesis protein TsaE
MTTQDAIIVPLADEEATQKAGRSLAATLYATPATVLLNGELGTGKTTFFRAFAEAVGITDVVTSPTYALEQRYASPSHGEVLHLDLYRLTTPEADELLKHSDHHEGIRCIEWADRLSKLPEQAIHLHFAEADRGRTLACTFADSPLPREEDVRQWRKDAGLPENVIRHCNAVAETAADIADQLIRQQHRLIRREAVRCGGLLHDLFRFLDFRLGGSANPEPVSAEQQQAWDRVRAEFPGMRHEAACAAFLRKRGYETLATIISTHGVQLPPGKAATIEQKILYYADKLVALDKRVTLEERFKDFSERYAGGKETPQNMQWYEQAKAVQQELFGSQGA